jgi:hypothetical protein
MHIDKTFLQKLLIRLSVLSPNLEVSSDYRIGGFAHVEFSIS